MIVYQVKETKMSEEHFIEFLKSNELITKQLMSYAKFYGENHHYDCCELPSDCDNCWGDSTERDLKEELASLFGKIYKEAGANIFLPILNKIMNRLKDQK